MQNSLHCWRDKDKKRSDVKIIYSIPRMAIRVQNNFDVKWQKQKAQQFKVLLEDLEKKDQGYTLSQNRVPTSEERITRRGTWDKVNKNLRAGWSLLSRSVTPALPLLDNIKVRKSSVLKKWNSSFFCPKNYG